MYCHVTDVASKFGATTHQHIELSDLQFHVILPSSGSLVFTACMVNLLLRSCKVNNA